MVENSFYIDIHLDVSWDNCIHTYVYARRKKRMPEKVLTPKVVKRMKVKPTAVTSSVDTAATAARMEVDGAPTTSTAMVKATATAARMEVDGAPTTPAATVKSTATVTRTEIDGRSTTATAKVKAAAKRKRSSYNEESVNSATATATATSMLLDATSFATTVCAAEEKKTMTGRDNNVATPDMPTAIVCMDVHKSVCIQGGDVASLAHADAGSESLVRHGDTTTSTDMHMENMDNVSNSASSRLDSDPETRQNLSDSVVDGKHARMDSAEMKACTVQDGMKLDILHACTHTCTYIHTRSCGWAG
jgi:hypothetical protein